VLNDMSKSSSARTPVAAAKGSSSKKLAPAVDPKMRTKPGKMVYYFGS
jgi:hypothetical protein